VLELLVTEENFVLTSDSRWEFEVTSSRGSVKTETLDGERGIGNGARNSESAAKAAQDGVDLRVILPLIIGGHIDDLLQLLYAELGSLGLHSCEVAHSVVDIGNLVAEFLVNGLNSLLHRLVHHLEAIIDLVAHSLEVVIEMVAHTLEVFIDLAANYSEAFTHLAANCMEAVIDMAAVFI